MAQIQFLDSAKSGCKGAVEPVVIQVPEVTFDTALDGTVATVISGGAVASAAPYGGSFINKGCESLTVDITYIVGSDCDDCSVDAYSTSVISIMIPANTVFDIPQGFWSEISYVLDNAASDVKLQRVAFQSFYTPDCPECIVAIPA